jgi:hypothetical protein
MPRAVLGLCRSKALAFQLLRLLQHHYKALCHQATARAYRPCSARQSRAGPAPNLHQRHPPQFCQLRARIGHSCPSPPTPTWRMDFTRFDRQIVNSPPAGITASILTSMSSSCHPPFGGSDCEQSFRALRFQGLNVSFWSGHASRGRGSNMSVSA